MTYYGNGLIYIKNIDIWKDKLRLTVYDSIEESTTYIFMSCTDGISLSNDIMNEVLSELNQRDEENKKKN